jgi:hypothetical protein
MAPNAITFVQAAPGNPLGLATGFRVPYSSGFLYMTAVQAKVMHLGFPNEYWQIPCVITDDNFYNATNANERLG